MKYNKIYNKEKSYRYKLTRVRVLVVCFSPSDCAKPTHNTFNT